MTVCAATAMTLLRRSIAFRQVIDSSQVRNCDSPRNVSELLERRHERLLRHVVGLGRRADARQRGPEDRPAVPFDQLAERVDVASLRQAHEVQVGGRGGLGCGHTVCRLQPRQRRLEYSSARSWL